MACQLSPLIQHSHVHVYQFSQPPFIIKRKLWTSFSSWLFQTFKTMYASMACKSLLLSQKYLLGALQNGHMDNTCIYIHTYTHTDMRCEQTFGVHVRLLEVSQCLMPSRRGTEPRLRTQPSPYVFETAVLARTAT